jgi:hypothetical protein
MNDATDTATPAAPHPVRWDEAIVATYLFDLLRGPEDDAD